MIEPITQPEALLAWLDGLADPTRLRLLRLLERHELGVNDLVSVMQLPQSTVSRHLGLLAKQGWLRSEARGTANLYRMPNGDLSAAARRLWLTAKEQTETWPTARQDRLRLERRLREKDGDAQAFFAGAASAWDKMRSELYGDGFVTAALLALLPGDWVVADLGCGTGSTAAILADSVQRVIGVDSSLAMLKAAARRTADHSNVELRHGRLESLPIETAACDAALLILTLTYLDEPTTALAEAHRILRADGRIVVVDLLLHDREDFRRHMGQRHPGFEPADLARLVLESGFGSARVSTLPPDPNAKGPALVLCAASKAGDASQPTTTVRAQRTRKERR